LNAREARPLRQDRNLPTACCGPSRGTAGSGVTGCHSSGGNEKRGTIVLFTDHIVAIREA
jgi:hypothetical protein